MKNYDTTKAEVNATDKDFTITINTNNRHYIDDGKAQEVATVECMGYALFSFNDESHGVQAQGKVNPVQLMNGMLEMYDYEKVRAALEEAQKRKMFKEFLGGDGGLAAMLSDALRDAVKSKSEKTD